MDDMELLECFIDTEIKTLDYKIQLARKAKNTKRREKYKSEKAGLKRALGLMNKIQDIGGVKI